MDRLAFINEIADYAVLDMIQTKVLASITIAQGMLESNSGNSAPGNNLFGIKATHGEAQSDQTTKEFVNGEWITIVDGFRCYASWLESINDHSQFLIENARYARAGFFDRCAELDYKGAAQSLQAAGYATDPNYSRLLISLVQQYRLDQYDKKAVDTMNQVIELEKRIAAIELLLKRVPAPAWFITEFGEHSLDGIVNDLTGDETFWRDVAINLRLRR